MLEAKLLRPNLPFFCFCRSTRQPPMRSEMLAIGSCPIPGVSRWTSPLGCFCSRIISVIVALSALEFSLMMLVLVVCRCWELLAPKGNRHLQNSAKLALITPDFPFACRICRGFTGWPPKSKQDHACALRWAQPESHALYLAHSLVAQLRDRYFLALISVSDKKSPKRSLSVIRSNRILLVEKLSEVPRCAARKPQPPSFR
jgi:hypothetical protein